MTSHVKVIIGLATSVLITGLAMILVRLPPSGEQSPERVVIHSAGILQSLWLLGNEPRLNVVETPNLYALRVAGMFKLRSRSSGLDEFTTRDVDDKDDGATVIE